MTNLERAQDIVKRLVWGWDDGVPYVGGGITLEDAITAALDEKDQEITHVEVWTKDSKGITYQQIFGASDDQ